MVYIPDDTDFSTFRHQCESHEGWNSQYNKAGVTVWSQMQETKTVQKIKDGQCCGINFTGPAKQPGAF
uniref:Uncharacterized protein n=1 Tax=Sphaerodactylus townsendi TaxID=933632 RepID=A0ACB8EBJ4_9SAUR